MSKNIVFIVNLPEEKKQGRSHPYQYSVESWKKWCNKNNCELFVLKDRIYPEDFMNANWHKLFIFQLLDNSGINYDQVFQSIKNLSEEISTTFAVKISSQ